MFKQFKKPVEEISFSKIFFISSIILIISIFWSIYDEIITRRPWKKYQKEFIELEYKKTLEEYNKEESYLNSYPIKEKYENLKKDFQSALSKLKSSEYKEIISKHGKDTIELNKVSREYQLIKAKLDEFDYEYYIAKRNNEKKSEPIKLKIEKFKEKLNSANKILLEKQSEFDKTKELKEKFSDSLNKTKKELQKITSKRDMLKEKLKSIRNRPIKIDQIIVEDLKRIDRCTTCHTAILKEGYFEYKEPFKSHPKDYLKLHPIEKFGCNVCHYGQGLAVDLPDAHGRVKHWEEPMYKKEYVQASCAKCHEAIRPHLMKEYELPSNEVMEVNMQNMEVINKGRRLFKELGCVGCHAINGRGGNISVDLGEIANKGIEELDFTYIEKEHSVANWMYEHFIDPQKVTKIRPLPGIIYGSPMPNYNLNKEDADALTTLMLSLTSEKKRIPHYYYKDKIKILPRPEIKYISKIEKGKAIFEKYGCNGCHGKNATKGIPNFNRQGGKIPELTKVGESYTSDELKDKIRKGVLSEPKEDPNGPTPPLWMPAWKDIISDEDIDALVNYLTSLLPSKKEGEW